MRVAATICVRWTSIERSHVTSNPIALCGMLTIGSRDIDARSAGLDNKGSSDGGFGCIRKPASQREGLPWAGKILWRSGFIGSSSSSSSSRSRSGSNHIALIPGLAFRLLSSHVLICVVLLEQSFGVWWRQPIPQVPKLYGTICASGVQGCTANDAMPHTTKSVRLQIGVLKYWANIPSRMSVSKR
jgi:hypothetical protein